ncbi:MAG TPA: adenylate/guanylate cyclase domain-containing protein [Gaiellaceae bacterium]
MFRDGDYFGRTVNLAARIADYARPREVLVDDALAHEQIEGVAFDEIGPVELKGVDQPVRLFRARRPD